MPQALAALLKSYDFLDRALSVHGRRLAADDRTRLARQRERVLWDILGYSSPDPRVTMAQLRFLLGNLSELASDNQLARALNDACQRQLNALARQLPVPALGTAAPAKHHHLDTLSDRIAILDADYRYVFTNKANAAFHCETAAAFIGRPSWLVTGEAFFEKVNKSRFDACLAGQSVSYISAHPGGDPAKLYSVSINPITDAGGTISSLIIACRDISNMTIPEDLIVPIP